MLLKTDEADEGLKITENKTISITYIFLLKYCLDLGLLHFPSWKFFFSIFLNTLDCFFQKNVRLVTFRVPWE